MAAASTSRPSSSAAVPLSPAKQGTSAAGAGPSSLLLENAGSFRIRAPVTADSDSSDFDSNVSDFSDGSSVADDDDGGFETEDSVVEEGESTDVKGEAFRPVVAKVVVGKPVAQLSLYEDEEEVDFSDVSDGENGAVPTVVARVPGLETKARVRVQFLEIREEEDEGVEVDELSDSGTVIGAPIENSDSANVAEFGSSLEKDYGSAILVESSEVRNNIEEVQAAEASMVKEQVSEEIDELSDSGTVIGAPNPTSDSGNVAGFGSSLDNDSGSAVVDESSDVRKDVPEVQASDASMVKEQVSEEKILTSDEEDVVKVEHFVTTAEPEVQEMVAESSGENTECDQNEKDSGKAVEEEEVIVVAADAGSATRPNYQSLELAENGGIGSFEEEELEEGKMFLLSDPAVSKDLTFEDCSNDSHTTSSQIPDLEVDPAGLNQSSELPGNGGTVPFEEAGEITVLSSPDVKDLTVEDCSSDSHTMNGRIAGMELGTSPNQSFELPGKTESFEEEVESKKSLPLDVVIEEGFEDCSDLQTNNGHIADLKIETGIEVKEKQVLESDGSRSSSFTTCFSDVSREISSEWSADTGSSFGGLSPLPANSANLRLIEDEKKNVFQMNQHLIVKLLRLINRLGCSPQDPIAAQVMYNLAGGYGSQELSFESSERLAMEGETEGSDSLDFSLNILVIGKTGVGKSSTINSIFGEKKASINAFKPATTVVNEVSGSVNGIRIRILDTPGLRSSFKDTSTNRKILSSVKKFMKKFPPDVVLYVDRLDDLAIDETADVTLLREITKFLTPSIWDNAIVVLTHASSPSSLPPEEDGPLSFEGFVARRCYGIQHAISLAVGDQLLVHPGNRKPVALADNQKEKNWTAQLLLMCCSVKILSEASGIYKTPLLRLANESGGDFVDSYVEAMRKKSVDSMDSDSLPEILLPPSFRYRPLEPTPVTLMKPAFDGYDGVTIERNSLSIANQFPSALSIQLTKDKNHFNLRLDSSALDRSTTMAGFDIQGETKVGNFKVNKTAFGMSIAILAMGMKHDDESRSSLSAVKWKEGLSLIGSLQSEMEFRRGSKVGVSVWMNDKKRGRISVKSSSLELQFAIMEIVPVVMAVLGRVCYGGSMRN